MDYLELRKENRSQLVQMEINCKYPFSIGHLDGDGKLIEDDLFSAEDLLEFHSNYYQFELESPKFFQYSISYNNPITNDDFNEMLIKNIFFDKFSSTGFSEAEWNKIVVFGPNTLYSLYKFDDFEADISYSSNINHIKVFYNKEEINSQKICTFPILKKVLDLISIPHIDSFFVFDSTTCSIIPASIKSGLTFSVFTSSHGTHFSLFPNAIIERDDVLFNILKLGISNPQKQREIEQSLNCVQFHTTHLISSITIIPTKFEWTINTKMFTISYQNKNISLFDYYFQTYNITLQSEEIVIVAEKTPDPNGIYYYPSSCLKVSGLLEAENIDSNITNTINPLLSFDNKCQQIQQYESAFITEFKEISSKYFLKLIGDNEIAKAVSLDKPHFLVKSQQECTLEHMPMEIRNSLLIPPRLNAPSFCICSQTAHKFFREVFQPSLQEAFTQMGTRFENPAVSYINFSFENFQEELFRHIKNQGTPSFIIIIGNIDLPRIRSLLTRLGVVSAVFSESKLQNEIQGNYPSYDLRDINTEKINEIALSILAKLGAVSYRLSYSSLPLQKTLMIGIFKNIFVSTFDSSFMRYKSSTINQSLSDFISEVLKLYYKYNFENPCRVVFIVDTEFNEKNLNDIIPLFNDANVIGIKVNTASKVSFKNNENKWAPNGIALTFDKQNFLIKSTKSEICRYSVFLNNGKQWSMKQVVSIINSLYYACPGHSEIISCPAPLYLAQMLSKYIDDNKVEYISTQISNFLYYLE